VIALKHCIFVFLIPPCEKKKALKNSFSCYTEKATQSLRLHNQYFTILTNPYRAVWQRLKNYWFLDELD